MSVPRMRNCRTVPAFPRSSANQMPPKNSPASARLSSSFFTAWPLIYFSSIMIERVGNVSAKTITRTARDRRPGIMGFAEALMITCNGRNKKKLSMNKLNWSNGRKSGEAPPDFEVA